MNGSRVRAIAGRILRQFRYDPRTVALIIVVPMVVMMLVGYLVGDSGKEPLPVSYVNLDGAVGGDRVQGPPAVGTALALALRGQPGIELWDAPSAEAAERRVEGGEMAGAIVVPAGTTEDMLAGRPAEITILVAGIEPGLDDRVIGAVRLALQGLAASGAAGALSVPQLALEGGSELSALDFFAPALIVVFVFLFTFMLTSVSFLRERSSGTLDRLMASPASRSDLLLGYLLGFIGFAMLQALVILGYSTIVLGVPIEGPPWLVLLALTILVIGVVMLGIGLSFYARNELQVVQFIPLILVPQIFLGGLFWPVQTLWPPLRLLSQLFPVTHGVVALRMVMVGGAGPAEVAGRLAALVAFAIAMGLLGVLALRKQRA
jgi:ABC-2 type transport system permease protein